MNPINIYNYFDFYELFLNLIGSLTKNNENDIKLIGSSGIEYWLPIDLCDEKGKIKESDMSLFIEMYKEKFDQYYNEKYNSTPVNIKRIVINQNWNYSYKI